MKRFRQSEHHEVEAELRNYRPEPRPAFLAALTADVHERMRRPNLARRAALVTALTVAILAVFATFGGIGYTSSAATNAIKVSNIERLVGVSHHSQSNDSRDKVTQDDRNPVFGDQYRPGKGCGDKNHVHFRENECKKLH